MCQRSKYHHRHKRSAESEKMKFYRHLRSFLFFQIAMLFLWMMGSGLAGLWSVAKIWGVFLLIHYLKVHGLPGTKGWLSRDWEDWMAAREANEYVEEIEDEPGRPEWKEKDLV